MKKSTSLPILEFYSYKIVALYGRDMKQDLLFLLPFSEE